MLHGLKRNKSAVASAADANKKSEGHICNLQAIWQWQSGLSFSCSRK